MFRRKKITDDIIKENHKPQWTELKAEPNMVSLVREQLKGTTLDMVKDGYADMTEKEKAELYANAELIRTNPAFKFVYEHIINLQGNYTVREALDINQVSFGRATINGVNLFNEEMKRLSNIYRETNAKEEDFDKHGVLAEE